MEDPYQPLWAHSPVGAQAEGTRNEEKALLPGDNDPIYARVCDSA